MTAPAPANLGPRLIVLPDIVQGTDEWHNQRRGMVTASVVGNLITVRRLAAIDYDCPDCGAPANEPCRSKTRAGALIKTLHADRTELARRNTSVVFKTASNETSRGLTALLVAERITGWTDETFLSDDMMRGIEEEPRARDHYSEHYAPVHETGFMIREHNGICIGYSPDGLVGSDGLIEIKSRRSKIQLQHFLSGTIPADNMAQLQCGLLVSGRKWLDYVSYCGGMPMAVTRVHPDPRWFKAILDAVHALEENAAEMIRLYNEATAGLPTTERVLSEMEIVF
ncbi:lambda exonuclease family protein [Nocardia sp. NPDC060249]|uniref:lambda exonuclease family protein n=1 Tax=Nocardia sp. NPDC060249 TaxID=3347082 RepID=UPI0036551F10